MSKRKALLKIIAALVVCLIAGAGIYYYVVIRPWIALPTEPLSSIEERFEQIETWGWGRADERHPQEQGKRLLRWMRAAEDDLQAYHEAIREGEEPLRTADIVQTVLALHTWHRSGEPLQLSRCDRFTSEFYLGLFGLAQATMDFAPPGQSVNHADAVLRLAAELRLVGDSLLFMTALDMTEMSLKALADKDQLDGLPTEDFLPNREEIFPMIARHVFCDVQLCEAALASDSGRRSMSSAKDVGQPTGAIPALELATARLEKASIHLFKSTYSHYYAHDVGQPAGANPTAEREIAWLKKFWVDLLEPAHFLRDDLARLSTYLDANQEELPPSLLVRTTISPSSRLIDLAKKKLAKCQKHMAFISEIHRNSSKENAALTLQNDKVHYDQATDTFVVTESLRRRIFRDNLILKSMRIVPFVIA